MFLRATCGEDRTELVHPVQPRVLFPSAHALRMPVDSSQHLKKELKSELNDTLRLRVSEIACRRNFTGLRISYRPKDWIVKLRRVEGVEKLGAQLKSTNLVHVEGFVQHHIDAFHPSAQDGPLARIAQKSGSRVDHLADVIPAIDCPLIARQVGIAEITRTAPNVLRA